MCQRLHYLMLHAICLQIKNQEVNFTNITLAHYAFTYKTKAADMQHMKLEKQEHTKDPQKLDDAREHVPGLVVAQPYVLVHQVHLDFYEEFTLWV